MCVCVCVFVCVCVCVCVCEHGAPYVRFAKLRVGVIPWDNPLEMLCKVSFRGASLENSFRDAC